MGYVGGDGGGGGGWSESGMSSVRVSRLVFSSLLVVRGAAPAGRYRGRRSGVVSSAHGIIRLLDIGCTWVHMFSLSLYELRSARTIPTTP